MGVVEEAEEAAQGAEKLAGSRITAGFGVVGAKYPLGCLGLDLLPGHVNVKSVLCIPRYSAWSYELVGCRTFVPLDFGYLLVSQCTIGVGLVKWILGHMHPFGLPRNGLFFSRKCDVQL